MTSETPLNPPTPPLRLKTHTNIRTRLLLSTLTGTPIQISQIRPSSTTSPGLAPHEISLLRLLDALTNGSHIEFSLTGTTLLYRPGLITGTPTGNEPIRHVLPANNTRGVSYFLEVLCILAPFSKAPFNVLLTGPGCITTSTPPPHADPSADTIRTTLLPLFTRFAISRNTELRILRRSGPGPTGTGGMGEVQLLFGHQVRVPGTLHLLRAGRVRRIRGVAYATGVGGGANARAIESARGVLNRVCGDVYVYSDVGGAPFLPSDAGVNANIGKRKQDTTAPAPPKRRTGVSHGLSLTAETSTGCLYSADACTPPTGGVPAEDIGRLAAFRLLEDIARVGCVGSVGVETTLVLMAMGSEDVGRVVLGRDVVGSAGVVGLAREVRRFGGAAWGVRDADTGTDGGVGGVDGEDGEVERERDVVVSVVGRGVGNVGRKIA